MTITIPTRGRGAWTGVGGTLSLDGMGIGPFYRAPAKGSGMAMPGTVAFRALRDKKDVSLNNFAVFCAVLAIQRLVNVEDDGLFGPATANAVKVWQAEHRIASDGIVGSQTFKTAYRPWVNATAKTAHPNDLPRLGALCCGHIGYESGGWDVGAVSADCHDVGLGQVNDEAHPDMSYYAKFEPETAIMFVVPFVADNMEAFSGDEDAQIAAYNLGRAGAREWVKLGKPDVFGKTKVREYINNVRRNI